MFRPLPDQITTGLVAQGLERTPDKREAGGSNPPRPTTFWGVSSDGRAPDLHSGGHRFDPGTLHQNPLDAGKPIEIVNAANTRHYLVRGLLDFWLIGFLIRQVIVFPSLILTVSENLFSDIGSTSF